MPLQRELQRRRGEPPRPGDLFVLPQTRDWPLEWAVLEQDPDGAERFLVVPADTEPLLGSRDLAVPADAASGPLSLRCRFGAWLGAEDFHPGRRTGLLPPEILARARHRRSARSVDSTSREQEAESDPEYGRWVGEVLVRAAGVLARPSRGAG